MNEGTFIDVNVDDAQEPIVLEDGSEELLRIVDAKTDLNKNNEPYILYTLEVPKHPTAKDFTQYYALPHESMTEKRLNKVKWNLKLFCDTFDIDFKTMSLEQQIGAEGWAILGVESDAEYGDKNRIKRLLPPK